MAICSILAAGMGSLEPAIISITRSDPLTGDVAAKNPYTRNLYGGSVGGPVIKDKTFFFINYQGDRFVTSLTNVSTVPTAAHQSPDIHLYKIPAQSPPRIPPVWLNR